MDSLLLYPEMEVSGFPAWMDKAPSPTGSDDSGLGWSPSPTTGDRKFLSESPERQYAVIKGLSEDCSPPAYNYDEPNHCHSQFGAPVNKSNNNNSEVHSQIKQQQLFTPEIESYIGALCESTSNHQNNTSSKSNSKKRNSITDQSLSIKLERCLQPKTGNGKPRQTSTKRKMSQKPKSKSKPYPGVRVPTVRQRLDQLKEQRRQRQQQVQLSPPQNFPTSMPVSTPSFSPTNTFTYPDMTQGRQPYSNDIIVKQPFSATEPQPADILSESFGVPDDLIDAPVTAFPLQISPVPSPHSTCDQQISSPCTQMGNVVSPPNVTISASMQPQLSPASVCTVDPSTPSSFYEAPHTNVYSTSQSYAPSPTYFNPSQTEQSRMIKTSPSYQTSFSNEQQIGGNYQDVLNHPAVSPQAYQTPSPPHQMYNNDQDQNFPSVHEIAAAGDIQMLQAHLAMHPGSVVEKDSSALLPIFYAIRRNQFEAVQMLLKSNSPSTYVSPDGSNMLHEAACLTSSTVLKVILNTLNKWDIQELINGKNSTISGGLTPLHIATQEGNLQSMSLLLKYGADFMVKADKTLWTPLHLAVKGGNRGAVQVLVEFAKTSTAYRVDFDMALAKQEQKLAIKNETLATVTSQKDYLGNTPLHFAADLQSVYGSDNSVVHLQKMFIMYLLENGADLNMRNSDYKTPSQLLPPIDTFPQSREIHALLGNVFANVSDPRLSISPSCLGTNIASFTFNRSPQHPSVCGQSVGSKGPFLQ